MIKLGRDFRGRRAWVIPTRTLQAKLRYCANLLTILGGLILSILTLAMGEYIIAFLCLVLLILSWIRYEKRTTIVKTQKGVKNYLSMFFAPLGFVFTVGGIMGGLLDMGEKYALMFLVGLFIYTLSFLRRKILPFKQTLSLVMSNIILVSLCCYSVFLLRHSLWNIFLIPLALLVICVTPLVVYLRDFLLFRRRHKYSPRNYLSILAGFMGLGFLITCVFMPLSGISATEYIMIFLFEGVIFLLGGVILHRDNYLTSFKGLL